MAKDSITFSHDSHFHGTHEYIESWVHLKIQVALNSNALQIQTTRIIQAYLVNSPSFPMDVGNEHPMNQHKVT